VLNRPALNDSLKRAIEVAPPRSISWLAENTCSALVVSVSRYEAENAIFWMALAKAVRAEFSNDFGEALLRFQMIPVHQVHRRSRAKGGFVGGAFHPLVRVRRFRFARGSGLQLRPTLVQPLVREQEE
jgi:hypothetical protein